MRIYIMTPQPKKQSKNLYKYYKRMGSDCEYIKKDTTIKLYKANIIFTDYDISEDRHSLKRVLWEEGHLSALANEIAKMYYCQEIN